MKLTVGLSSADRYPGYVAAGADEVFCGYIPDQWTSANGLDMPLNRREVRYCPVQIGGRNELRILSVMQADLGVPVVLTFNSPCYPPSRLPMIAGIMEDCLSLGFDSFIVADPALIQTLEERKMTRHCKLHLSGEAGEINTPALESWRKYHIARVIFPRQTTLTDMDAIIRRDKAGHPHEPITYEAFGLNEMCHYTGAFCSALHCDEFAHLCHLPWKTAPVEPIGDGAPVSVPADPVLSDHAGCAVCSLRQLASSGVDVLKVVGRGAPADEMLESIRLLRAALTLTEMHMPPAEIRQKLFHGDCPESCYYPGT